MGQWVAIRAGEVRPMVTVYKHVYDEIMEDAQKYQRLRGS